MNEEPDEVVVVDRVGSTQIEQNQMECLSAIERILLEYDEIESNPSDNFKCLKLDWNPYEWQFVVRGADGTEFEGGIYHGRLLFPGEYPFKPPSIVLLTENGRFATQTEIWSRRLNLWQPSWRVRDVLVDFIHLMLPYPDGELGSLEYNKEESRALANKSRAAAPQYGTAERQKLINLIHTYILSKVPAVPFPQLQVRRNTPCQNSGEKRILEEYNEIESNPSDDLKCLMLDGNPYEWQFAIRGPSGTEFEGGIYHGEIQFSKGYPSKPPSIKFLTKNGRLKTQTDISSWLLSNWQSPRSVRNALLALIEKMPTYPDGDDDLDSVKYNKEVRRAQAIKSRAAAPKCERQKLIDEIHEYMLSKAQSVPQLQLSSPSQASNEHEHEHYQNDGAKRKHGRGRTSQVFVKYWNHAIDSFLESSEPESTADVGIHGRGRTSQVFPKSMIKTTLVLFFLLSSMLIYQSFVLKNEHEHEHYQNDGAKREAQVVIGIHAIESFCESREPESTVTDQATSLAGSSTCHTLSDHLLSRATSLDGSSTCHALSGHHLNQRIIITSHNSKQIKRSPTSENYKK